MSTIFESLVFVVTTLGMSIPYILIIVGCILLFTSLRKYMQYQDNLHTYYQNKEKI